MKEDGGVSTTQTAAVQKTSRFNTHFTLRNTQSRVNKRKQDHILPRDRKSTARRKKTHNQRKNCIEDTEYLDISDCESLKEICRTSLPDPRNSLNGTALSVESDTSCNDERNVPLLGNVLNFTFKRNRNQQGNFDIWNSYGVKIKPEYERCKHAVVYLRDIFKVKKEQKNGTTVYFSDIENLVKMKSGGSRSPKRHSPVRGSVTTQNAKDSVAVRTTYIKPGSQDSLLDGNNLAAGKSNSCTILDGLLEKELPGTDSPKQKKKTIGMDKTVTKNESPVLEQNKTQKKRSPTVHGDNAMLATDQEKASKKNTDKGDGEFDTDRDGFGSDMNKGKSEMENSGTPKKRGRKPKSADSPPVKVKRKKSAGPNAENDISNSQSKDGKKIPKSSRTKKKSEECENPLEMSKQNDKTVEKETLTVKAKSRGTSESPSPVRRKRSPKKEQGENESPKSKKAGSIKKSKKAKVLNENDDNNAVESQSVKSSVDEVIDAVVNENIAMLNKSTASKSPSRKNKQENSGKKSTSPSKDKKQTPKEKKSVKTNSQEKEVCSVEKKKPRSRSNSASPRKEQKKLDPKLETNGDDESPKRKLNFDDDITRLIIEKSKLPFPSDFQYKFTSSGIKPALTGLDDLINKVNSSVKDRDDSLTAILGEAEEPDYESDEKSSSPVCSDVNVSTDSDKTISEFVDLPENSNEITDIGLKDNLTSIIENATKDVDLLDNVRNDNLENFETEKIPEQNEDEKETSNEENVSKLNSDKGKESEKDFIKHKCGSSEIVSDSNVLSNIDQLDTDEITCENKCKSVVNDDEQMSVETVSIFDMFGLTLKRPKPKEVAKLDESFAEQSQCEKEVTENDTGKCSDDKQEKTEEEDDDVMFISETKPDSSIVILSDDDETEGRCVDRTGYESLKESAHAKVRPKFTTVNNVVEPKPLDVLVKLEKADSKNENAFACNELDEYLHLNKENIGPTQMSQDFQNSSDIVDKELDVKEELKKAEPDFDEVGGHVFVSFASEHALKAHVYLEKKIDWLTEAQLKKMAHLKQMKERQHDSGSRRITDVKSGEEQKQNFRGIPMRLMKYQKMLKQEMEDILLGRQSKSQEKSPSKTPTKTTDITKIKGWKSKFQNTEELQEATGLNISESGKVHWKTEERLVKNLDPEEIKDIGLDLKKKRRKLVNYTGKKKSGHGSKTDEKDSEMMEYEYEIDDLAIIESDVFNEDEGKPPPEKIPYNVKYSSQHKYGVRKLFVKKMKLDAEDERILQKLGTQKHIGQKPEVSISPNKRKKGKQVFSLSKLTHTMAVAAVSAFDKTLLNRAIGMEKAEISRKKKMDARLARKEGKMSKNTVVHKESQDVKEESDVDEHHDDDYDDIPPDAESDEDNDEAEEDNVETLEELDNETERNVKRTRRHSTVNRNSNDKSKSGSEEDVAIKDEEKVEIKTENPDTCTEPGPIITGLRSQSKDCYLGCRYGCICHLCKLSDSGEEKEPDFKPPCDKEYCRLGCICDSIDTKSAETHHCRKPGCMFECKCPPKQPKPDIPRERDHSKKKRGRGARRKKRTVEKKECEGSGKEEDVLLCDDNEWEPPSKKKRGASNSRFANLPKRETTYRLAKNLDAVSRKAMEVYASSEMFIEQKVRRRRSDQGYEDGTFMPLDSQERSKSSARLDEKTRPRLNEITGMLEISDEDSDESDDLDVYPEDLVSCARILPYNGPYKKKRDLSQLNKRKGGPSSSKRPPKTVIDLVDSDKEDNSGDTKDRQELPSTSNDNFPQSVTEKMGLTNKIINKTAQANQKWKTQMVCLKAKKKSDDKSQDPEAEIKLLEIMSNCNWEIDRTNMLSKISHIISKGSVGATSISQFIAWGAYSLEFLPKAEKPAVIPPELKSKLPNEMFSIRIKVTKNICKEDKIDQTVKETVVVDEEDVEMKSKEMTEEEKKRYNMKLQKKLIEKIKFAERLRNLIIAEEQKGVTKSKFSVSREGIEKALKKYKTQLWKAYTGTSNFTIQQLKQALQAAKSSAKGPSTSDGNSKSVTPVTTATSGDLLSSSTISRIQSNQGVTVKTSVSSSGSFINLGNLHTSVSALGSSVQTVGNLVIHGGLPVSGHSTNQETVGQKGFIENIENVKNVDGAHKAPATQTSKSSVSASKKFQMPSASVVSTVSSDVVLMPIDNNMLSGQLPHGVKLAVLQPTTHPDGSPVPLAVGQPSVASGQLRFNSIVIANSSQNSDTLFPKSVVNPAIASSASGTQMHSQGFKGANASVVSCFSGPLVAPQHQGSGSSVQTSGNGFPPHHCVPVGPLPNAPPTAVPSGFLPLKNISNFGMELMPAGTGGVLPATKGTSVSPSIYPIRFANTVPSKMHVAVPPNEMIGLPKVASMPLKVVQEGKQVFLIPMTSTVAPGSMSATVATSSNVNLPLLSTDAAGSVIPRQRPISPMFIAVPVQDKVSTAPDLQNHISTVNSNVETKNTDIKDNESKLFTLGEENDSQTLEPDISEKGIAQGKKLSIEAGKRKGLNGQISENCDNAHIDSDDNCDIDSLASSTRSLSSLSDIMKTDINTVELKLDHNKEKLEEDSSNKDSLNMNKSVENDEVQNILDTAKATGMGKADVGEEIDESDKGRSCSDSAAEVKRLFNTENLNRNESKSDSDCVVLDDTDEDCVIHDQKELDRNQFIENEARKITDKNKCQKSANLKRLRMSDFIDSIDSEHELSKVQDHLENDQQKEESNGYTLEAERETMWIEDSEESDVDVTSYEAMESLSYIFPGVSWSGQQGTNKRKSQHKVAPEEDDFEIKKVKMEPNKDTSQLTDLQDPSKRKKKYREKYRRLELRHLFAQTERTVFKYNSKMQRYRGKIPKHMILQEALNLLAALTRREGELKESLHDGKQYKETLEAHLKQQIDSFVKSGVPEPIIKNFLKSVEKSFNPVAGKQKKKVPQTSLPEPIEITDSEESDTALDYDALTPAKVQLNWTKLVDDHLCSLDTDMLGDSTCPDLNLVGSPQIVKVISVHKHQDLLRTQAASSSVEKEAVKENSSAGKDSQPDISDGCNSQEKKTMKAVTELEIISGSPVTSELQVGCASSPLTVVAHGQKSSSDDDEVRSSTGDALIEHDIQNEMWIDNERVEAVLHKKTA